MAQFKIASADYWSYANSFTYNAAGAVTSMQVGNGTTPSAEAAATPPKTGRELFDEANTTFAGFDKLCNSNTELCADLRKIMNPAINASDNRLSSGQGYSFDSSGNTTTDPQGRTFTYDEVSLVREFEPPVFSSTKVPRRRHSSGLDSKVR